MKKVAGLACNPSGFLTSISFDADKPLLSVTVNIAFKLFATLTFPKSKSPVDVLDLFIPLNSIL